MATADRCTGRSAQWSTQWMDPVQRFAFKREDASPSSAPHHQYHYCSPHLVHADASQAWPLIKPSSFYLVAAIFSGPAGPFNVSPWGRRVCQIHLKHHIAPLITNSSSVDVNRQEAQRFVSSGCANCSMHRTTMMCVLHKTAPGGDRADIRRSINMLQLHVSSKGEQKRR